MNRPLKAAVVCFSASLLAGYVYLGAGEKTKVMPSSKLKVLSQPTTSQSTTITVFPGSKSAAVVTPAVIQSASTQPTSGISLGPPTTLPVFFPDPKPPQGILQVTGTNVHFTNVPATQATSQPAQP